MAATANNNVRIRHACIPTTLLDVNRQLTQECQALLDTTPFRWVSKLEEEPKISSVLLSELVSRWDQASRGFKVRGMVIPFTLADVCLAVGLPATGNRVVGVDGVQCYTLSMFEGAEMTVEGILNKMLMLRGNVGDFVRAYILLAFGEFYFPRTGRLIFTDFAWLLDDLGAMHSYNWAHAVYEYLVDSLTRVATAISDRRKEHQTHLCGCAAILQIWAMNHMSIGQPPGAHPQHPFPRFLNWPIVLLKKRRMKEACDNAKVTVALTATDDELKERIVGDALQLAQQHGYVHIDEHERVLAKLREHEQKIKELQADVRMLKDADYRRRSHTVPAHAYGGNASFGGHDATPSDETPVANIHTNTGGIGGSHLQTGMEIVSTPHMVAEEENFDPPVVGVAGDGEEHVESQTGGDNREGASNIATRIKGKPRTRTQNAKYESPYITRGKAGKKEKTQKQ